MFMNGKGCNDKMYNNLYQKLIKRAMTENRKLEKQLKKPLNNYDKLYYETTLPFKEDRMLHIRRINVPTFTEKNNPSYYNIFLNDISFWRKGEIKQLHTRCLELIDKRGASSYTIFQAGKLHGRFNLNENMKYYGMYILNTNVITGKHIERIINVMQKNLRKKCEKAESGHVVFGGLKKDIKRIQDFISYLDVLKHDTYIFTTKLLEC